VTAPLWAAMAKVEQLAGMDAAFLYMETPTQHMHVCGTMILEPIDEAADGGEDATAARRAAAERLTDLILRRIAELPEFRRRIVETPLSLSHPAWVEVPRFRPRNQVRQVTVDAPGTSAQLAEVVGRIAAKPLDRRRPLWELWIVQGLERGRIGVVLKVHHAVVDGIAALGVLGRLFTTEPGTAESPQSSPRRPRRRPAPTPLDLAGAVWDAAAEAPGKIAHALNRTGHALVSLARDSVHLITTRERPAMWFSSPRTVFNCALTAERAVAFGRVPLATVKRIKNAFGVTVNDVVLAACARALGHYLREHGEAPQRPLVASVPISEHGIEGPVTSINRASVMFIGLPVHLDDPAAVVRSIHEQSIGGKRVYETFGPYMLAEWVDIAPPPLFAAAMGAYSRWKLAEYVPPVHSLVISNVPGPPMPLYAGGARLVAAYPFGPILEGAAVNISVMSYDSAVDMGLITCPRAVPRPAEIARGFERAVDELAAAADSRAKESALYGLQA
jgi:diacylglycerol O-acyltransferase